MEEALEVLKQKVGSLEAEAEEVNEERHAGYQELLTVLDATRLRLMSIAEIQYQLAIQHAKHTLDYTKEQINNDYKGAKDDIKEKLLADLRKKRRDANDLAESLKESGVQVPPDLFARLDVVLPNPNRRRPREHGRSQRQPYASINLKLSEHDIKEDNAYIQSLHQQTSS